ncbi:hypothetical protein RUM43_014498 [Polyplax serrata]|uniref:Uncharacterized protein n=1 Tax=Polyplax serrata TaxID=468196 RepID=A0AAN8PG31_POLSC
MAVHVSESSDEFIQTLENRNVPVTINAEEMPLSKDGIDTRTPSDVVFISQARLNVTKVLEINIWTGQTFFVLDFKRCHVSEEDLLEIFTDFWTENIVKVVAFVSALPMNEPLIYGYVPFSEASCNRVRLVKEVLASGANQLKLVSSGVTDFYGCVLNTSAVDLPPMVIFTDEASRRGTFDLEGTEISIIKEVSKKMNFTPWFSKPKDGHPWGWIHPEPHGAAGEVYLKESHFGVGLLATTLERFQYLDVSAPVSPILECITFAVPLGAVKNQHGWMEIYVTEFSLSLWIYVGVTFALAALTYWTIAKNYQNRRQSVSGVGFFLFSTFLGVPVKAPVPLPLKCFFLGWIWYSYITVVSYQSLMKGRLTVPYRPREIETIRDFLDSHLQCVGYYNSIVFVTYKAEGDLKELAARCKPVRFGMKEGFDRVVTRKDIGYLREITSFKYYTLINPRLKGKVHYVKECASEYYPIMVLQRNSPLTKPTNKLIWQLFESGILMKWRNKYIHDVKPVAPPVIKLSLRHTFSPFIALLSGIFLSVLIFFAEQCAHRKILRVTNVFDVFIYFMCRRKVSAIN